MATLPSLLLLFVFYVALPIIPFSHSIPFILLHGINDDCASDGVTKFAEKLASLSGSQGHCVEVGNGKWDSWFMPLKEQAETLCEQVKGMKELSEGYNIVGQSQGNIVARGLIEFCEGGPPVRNYISLGGPHAGIGAIPKCGSDAICRIADQLIKSEIYSDFVQEHLAPSGYLKLPNAIPKYLEECRYLPAVNNELPDKRNSTYKDRFSSLENLVLIMFENDTVLIPKETSWFGYYPDGSFDPVLPPKQTKLYIEDWIGLRSLDEAGKVQFIGVGGNHLQLSEEEIVKYVAANLKNQAPIKHRNVNLSRKHGVKTRVGESGTTKKVVAQVNKPKH